MAAALRRLFEPASLGRLNLKNRIVMSPMGVMFHPDFIEGELSPRLLDYYEERARGGAGLIMVSSAYSEAAGRPFEYGIGIWEDRFIPALSQLTERVHRYGAKIGLHLLHGGSYSRSSLTGTQPVSASASFTNWLTRETPRELTIPEIRQVVANFAQAVRRAREAGFDLVEYNAYSGYLIREFLSPVINTRQDEYGGELENRLRFFKEIVYASREVAGPDFTLIAKISGNEYLPGGNGLAEAGEIARAVESWGVDGLHVSPAGHETTVPLTPGLVPKGAFIYLANTIKEQVQVPVITAHIGDVFLAEAVLAQGQADFIAFGRQLLADPEMPLKAEEGRFEDIRPCIRCVQGCYDRVFLEHEVTCLMNPAVGREREYEIHPAPRQKKVMVVGGGPGGLEAAQVCALRGHKVSLYEARDRLGGQFNACAVPPGKEDFATAITYFSTQLSKLGVEVSLNTPATPELVEREKPDALIVASGAEPVVPPIPGVEGQNVVTAFDVLEGRAEVGKRVVVVGGGGIGCETAFYLARQGTMDAETALFLLTWKAIDPETALSLTRKGKEVTILEMLPQIAGDIGMSRRGFLRRLLTLHGVKVITQAEVTAITASGVEFLREGQPQVAAADTVVLAVGTRSQNQLYDQLQGRVPELYLLGDAKQPGKAMDAIHQAAAIARQI